MQVIIDITEELAARMHALGLDPSSYFSELAGKSLANLSPDDTRRRDAVNAMLAFADAHGFTTGGQSLKGMIHEEHKR